MSFISDIRKFFVPDFKQSVISVHERLAAQNYAPVKEFLDKANPELEEDLFVNCFITDNKHSLPIAIGGADENDAWIVSYATVGSQGIVHTRVRYSQSALPVVDQFIIIETKVV